jgi:folate-binding protein YgfZ
VSPSFLELPWRAAIRMTGRDRVRFLHGMCTNDIKKLQPGQSCMAAVVNRQGKLVADITALATAEALLLLVERSNLQGTIDALSKFLVADDVQLEPAAIALVGVYGPDVQLPSGIPTVPDPTLPDGRVLLVPLAEKEETLRRLASSGGRAMTESEFETGRVENGFPRWGVDMGPDVLPMEAGLEPIAISYTKGCYIGQEVIQRVKTYSEPPKILVQLDVAGAAPGDKIHAGGQEIGHLTSAAQTLALGYVRKEFKAPGTHVEVAGRPAHVRALPWHARVAP